MTERKKPAVPKKTGVKSKTRTKKTTAVEKIVDAPKKHAVTHRVQTEPSAKHERITYIVAIGRRKSAVARIRYTAKGSGLFLVNGQDARVYFPTFEMQKIINDPFELVQHQRLGDLSIKVNGGGKHGQSEAVRLGISRLLVTILGDHRTPLKRAGFLTRDPRVKERKKYGLKRARRAPQWQKR